MKKINHSDYVSGFISSGLKIRTKTYVALWIAHLTLDSAIALYIIKYFDKLDFASLIETGTLFVFYFRMLLYLMSLQLFGSRMMTLLAEINDERNKFQNIAEVTKAKESFAKIEFWVTFCFSVDICVMYLGLMLSVLFMKSNQHQLPIGFVIIFFPFDVVFSVNWFLNYIFQVITIFFAVVLFIGYTLMVLAIVNHSCMMFDELIIIAQSLRENSREYPELKLKDLVERSQVVFTRHEKAKRTLQFHFFVEFSLLSFMICFSLYASLIMSTLLSLMVVIVSMVQLFVFCFMGERVSDRIKRFEATVYDLKWYSIQLKEQKAILFLLVKIRDTKGFNGIFNSVDRDTFLQIVKFTYSMFMVLLSRQ